MTDTNDEKFMQDASRLATEVSPERDLWPGIEQAIKPPVRSRWTPRFAQAAAVLVLVGASSMITYQLTHQEPTVITADPVLETPLTFEQVALGQRQTFESVYTNANGPLSAQLDAELDKLPPETRSEIETNLALIRQAIDDIHQALDKEPDNAFLQALLVETYRKELGLVNDVSRLVQRTAARKDI